MSVDESNPNVKAYRALQKKRLECLRRHQGQDSDEQDDVLDEMDDVWWGLTDEEIEYLNKIDGPYSKEIVEWLDKWEPNDI